MANSRVSMTPAAALARHLEWLEFALAAAKDEEARRQGRLDRATDKNRDKRTTKLAEVSAEVRELASLVRGIKDLQAGASEAAASTKAATRAASKAPARGTARASPKPRSGSAPASRKPPSAATRRANAKSDGAPASPKPRSGATRRATAKSDGASANTASTRGTTRRGRRNENPSTDQPS
jgi:hypothetical protein